MDHVLYLWRVVSSQGNTVQFLHENHGGSGVQFLHENHGGSGAGVEYYVENSTAGATTITFTAAISGVAGVVIVMQPFSGVAHSGSFDAMAHSTAGSSCPSTLDIGAVTTTNAKDLLIMFYAGVNDTLTFSNISPFTVFGQGTQGGASAGMAYNYVTSTGTYTGQMDVTDLCVSGATQESTIVAFKAL